MDHVEELFLMIFSFNTLWKYWPTSLSKSETNGASIDYCSTLRRYCYSFIVALLLGNSI